MKVVCTIFLNNVRIFIRWEIGGASDLLVTNELFLQVLITIEYSTSDKKLLFFENSQNKFLM